MNKAPRFMKEYAKYKTLNILRNELIFGFERPKAICKTVENWNLKSTKNCINQMKKLEDQARDKGFQTLSVYLESAINDDGNISGVSLYSLRKTLDAADDMLSAESPYLAQIQYKDIKSGYSYDYKGVRLDPEAKAYILEHPEELIMIKYSNSTQRGSLCMNRRGKLWY